MDLLQEAFDKFRPFTVKDLYVKDGIEKVVTVEEIDKSVFKYIHITPGLEEEEANEIGDLIALYSNYKACAEKFADYTKNELAITCARILKDLKAGEDGKKLTVQEKEAELVLDPRHKPALLARLEAQFAVNALEGIIDGLKAKRDMLKVRHVRVQ